MSELTYLDDGRIALSTGSDPAIEAVHGYTRYYLGLDLGRHDPSAFVLIHDEQKPEWHPDNPYRQRLAERQRTVVWADRVKDTAYTDLARHVASLMAKRELDRRTKLIVDATGLGGPFCDVLREGGIDHTAVTMTAGHGYNRQGPNRYTVSKNHLLETLASAFETNTLKIAHDLPLANQLRQEIASFELETTAAGNLVLTGGGKGHHADLAIATALAFWGSEILVPYSVGERKLENWF